MLGLCSGPRCCVRQRLTPACPPSCSCCPLGAGVLALLQEAGESQTVVVAGEQWLSTHKRDPHARDVAISTALAHCGVAAQYSERRKDAISASGMYQVAAELLAQHKAPNELQREVAEALRELQPQVGAAPGRTLSCGRAPAMAAHACPCPQRAPCLADLPFPATLPRLTSAPFACCS